MRPHGGIYAYRMPTWQWRYHRIWRRTQTMAGVLLRVKNVEKYHQWLSAYRWRRTR